MNKPQEKLLQANLAIKDSERRKLHKLLDRMLDEGWLEGTVSSVENFPNPCALLVEYTLKLEVKGEKLMMYRDYV